MLQFNKVKLAAYNVKLSFISKHYRKPLVTYTFFAFIVKEKFPEIKKQKKNLVLKLRFFFYFCMKFHQNYVFI